MPSTKTDHWNESHGHAGHGRQSKTYQAWNSIITRCTNPNSKDWEEYGGRGIKVCPRWRWDFELFLADMGEAPPGKSIDRKDTDGNYEPGNCRWATMKEQNRNRRNNRTITANGKTQCIAAWAEELGTSRQTLRARLECGLSDSETINRPIGKYRKANHDNR